MTHNILRIATRKSPLALWQTNFVRDVLISIHPNLQIELVEISTQGDKILDTPLAKIGGKGLFVKELENTLQAKQTDIAVHSMKDVPVELPSDLIVGIILERKEPYDAFVSNHYSNLDELPQGAIVGTASLRRQCQILALRPDLKIHSLRGNVGTRLRKLDEGQYDAIILAEVGLRRLNFEKRISDIFKSTQMLPAIGQGAIGIEYRIDDEKTLEFIKPLHDKITQQRIIAERALNEKLEGGCQVPIAGFAQIINNILNLEGLVGDIDGKKIIRRNISGSVEQAESLGKQLGQELIAEGARSLIAKAYNYQSD